MKKRLLITSIVMMLVVAVALSTATYAWFTSNARVEASSVTMTAAISDADSIGISWVNSGFGTSITATGPANTARFVPAAIADNVTTGTPTEYADTLWSSSTIFQEGGKNYFNSGDIMNAIDTATNNKMVAYTWQDDNSHKDFYINNPSTANDITDLYIHADVVGKATDFIRIAVFKENTTSSEFELAAILAGKYVYTPATGKYDSSKTYYDATGAELNVTSYVDGETDLPADTFTRADRSSSANVAVGVVEAPNGAINPATTKGVTSADTSADPATWGTHYCIKEGTVNAVGSISLGALAHQGVMHLKVVIWMDGTALNDSTAGTAENAKASSITLTFSTSANA